MPTTGKRILALIVFAAAWLGATTIPVGVRGAVTQAAVWLPTGVAIAGVWLRGYRAAGVVFVCVLTTRMDWHYPPLSAGIAALGSAVEAVVGAAILRGIGLVGTFATLRDVAALFTCAVLAPCVSLLFRVLRNVIFTVDLHATPYQHWDGWWRMNGLGILIVVPLALACLRHPRPPSARRTLARLGEAFGFALLTVVLVAAVMTTGHRAATSLMLLYLLLPVTLGASLRFGPRGALCTAALGAACVLALASRDIGPFAWATDEERVGALQIFLVTLVCVPLVFGALVAEREASASRWQQSEGLRRALVQVSPDVMYRLRDDGTFVDVMARPGTVLPFAPAAMLGHRYQDISAPTVAARWAQQIARARQDGTSDPVEYPVATAAGVRDREVRFVRLPPDEVLAVVRDITDRKRAERQLAWQARVLERIAAGQPLADTLDQLVRGIEKFLAPCTGSISLRRGDRLFSAAAPSLPAAIVRYCEGLEIRDGNGACGTAAFTRRTVICHELATDPFWTGHWPLWEQHGLRACWSVPVRSATDSLLGTFAIYHPKPETPTTADLALVERAATLAALAIERHRREALLVSIERNVGEGLFRCVLGAGFVYVNEAFARLFGYASPTAFLARRREDGDDAHHQELATLARQPATNPPAEVELHRRDGSTFWALVSIAEVADADDGQEAFVGTLTDITARRTLEDRLRHSQKLEAVGQLAGGVAHDFNNMLSAIVGYGEGLRDQLPANSPLRHDAEEVLAAAMRAAGLTRQLLAFARRQVLNPTVLDLGLTISQLGGMLQRLIGEHIRCHAPLPGRPICARVDHGQFEQAIVNLALNARDAMPHGGTLTIVVQEVDHAALPAAARSHAEPGRYAAISVSDTGSGMTPEVLARAFDPFFTTKEPGKGTGLGLSSVHGIVNQSGGAVWIDSHAGGGTAVWIFLPLAEAAPAPLPPVEIPRRAPRQGTVLVAEDETLVRELVVRCLGNAGFEVLTAVDGREALARFLEHRHELTAVVTDVVMPRLGGVDLARTIWSHRPLLPVLFMSGYTRDDTPPDLERGRSRFLQKPFTTSSLLAVLDELMATSPSAPATVPPPA